MLCGPKCTICAFSSATAHHLLKRCFTSECMQIPPNEGGQREGLHESDSGGQVCGGWWWWWGPAEGLANGPAAAAQTGSGTEEASGTHWAPLSQQRCLSDPVKRVSVSDPVLESPNNGLVLPPMAFQLPPHTKAQCSSLAAMAFTKKKKKTHSGRRQPASSAFELQIEPPVTAGTC